MYWISYTPNLRTFGSSVALPAHGSHEIAANDSGGFRPLFYIKIRTDERKPNSSEALKSLGVSIMPGL